MLPARPLPSKPSLPLSPLSSFSFLHFPYSVHGGSTTTLPPPLFTTTMQPCVEDLTDDPDKVSFTSTTTIKRSTSSESETTCTTSSIPSSSTTTITASGRHHRALLSKDPCWNAIHRATSENPALTLSDLRFVHRLGSGDIGSVYLVELKNAASSGCLFAAKVMDKKELMSRNKETRARIEKEILEMLDHPFLPTLYATLDCPRWSCLLTDFCPGGDLHVLRQRQPDKRFQESAVR